MGSNYPCELGTKMSELRVLSGSSGLRTIICNLATLCQTCLLYYYCNIGPAIISNYTPALKKWGVYWFLLLIYSFIHTIYKKIKRKIVYARLRKTSTVIFLESSEISRFKQQGTYICRLLGLYILNLHSFGFL